MYCHWRNGLLVETDGPQGYYSFDPKKDIQMIRVGKNVELGIMCSVAIYQFPVKRNGAVGNDVAAVNVLEIRAGKPHNFIGFFQFFNKS